MPYPRRELLPTRPNECKDEVLDKRSLHIMEDCLALSWFFQNPTYRALISAGASAGT